MRVRAKLGCLRKAERVNHNTIRQEYACWSVNLDLPDEGKRDEESGCPVCGTPLGLRLSSVPSAQVTLATILLAAALGAGVLGGGFAVMASRAAAYVAAGQHLVERSQGRDATFGPKDAAISTTISWVAFGAAGLLLAGAAAATALPAGVFASMGMLVGFSREPVGFNLSAVQGHRVLQLDPLADPVPAEAA